ncbi:Uncharacterised protein [uncultured archaeon]|nr:Uncharacterised protein [uncultured archaeon]
MKTKVLTCNQPDRDVPGIICGYPLPCPHHTVTITSQRITIPIHSPGQSHRRKLKEIRDALFKKDI